MLGFVKLNHTASEVAYLSINSKWIKDFNIRPETITLLEENTAGKFLDTGPGHDFSDTKAKATKARLNK